MRLLSSGTRAQTLVQHNPKAWVWVYEFILEETELVTRPFRVTSFNEPVTIAGKTYRPFPITHEAIAGDSQGNLPQFSIVVSNVSREIGHYVELAKGLSGNRATVGIYNRAAANPGDLISFTFEIASTQVTDELVTCQLELPSFYRYRVPAEIFTRGRCEWAYKGEECAYRGSLATCDKTLFGVNGCVVHGDDEEANNLPRMHPRRNGSYPALQRFAV